MSAYVANFNGSTQYASVNSSLTYATTCTVEMWVCVTSYKTDMRFFEAFQATGAETGQAVSLCLTGSSAYLQSRNSGSQFGTFSTAVVPLNTWTHIAMTTSAAGVVNMYINGVNMGTVTLSVLSAGSRKYTYFGKSMDPSASKNFTGQMSEMRVWNVERTPAQIAANYTLTLPTTTAGLLLNVSCNALKNAPRSGAVSVGSNILSLVKYNATVNSTGLAAKITNLTTLSVSTTSTPVSRYGAYDGTITVLATGGDITYSWTDSSVPSSSTSAYRSNLSAGTYMISVSNGASTSVQTVTLAQPAAFLYLTSTPVTVTATWPRVPGELTYKVTFRKQGDVVDSVPYPNTRENSVILKGLSPAALYTVSVYSSSTGVLPATLKYTASVSTGVNSVGNFVKDALKTVTATTYDVSYLSNSTVAVNTASVISGAFVQDDRIASTAIVSGSTQAIQPKVLKVNGTTSVSKGDSIVVPFDPTITAPQAVTLQLRDATVATVTYNNVLNSVTIGGVTYQTGDTFTLDNQRVTVNAQ